MMIEYNLDILQSITYNNVRNLNLKFGGCNKNSFKVACW